MRFVSFPLHLLTPLIVISGTSGKILNHCQLLNCFISLLFDAICFYRAENFPSQFVSFEGFLEVWRGKTKGGMKMDLQQQQFL